MHHSTVMLQDPRLENKVNSRFNFAEINEDTKNDDAKAKYYTLILL